MGAVPVRLGGRFVAHGCCSAKPVLLYQESHQNRSFSSYIHTCTSYTSTRNYETFIISIYHQPNSWIPVCSSLWCSLILVVATEIKVTEDDTSPEAQALIILWLIASQMVQIVYVLSTSWEMHCWWIILNWIVNDYMYTCTRFISIVWLLYNQPLTNTDKIDWKCWLNENRRLIHLGNYPFSITCCSNFVFLLHFLVDHGLAFNFVNINWINGKFLCLFDDNVKKGKTCHSKSTFTPLSTGATPPKSFPGTPASQHTSQCINPQDKNAFRLLLLRPPIIIFQLDSKD